MAVNEIRTVNPKLPRLDQLDPGRFAFDYDRPSDTLYLYFEGQPPPAVSIVVSDELLYLVDPVTERVVGLQIEAFLTRVAYRWPALLDVAEFGGVTPEEVARVRERIAPSERKRAAVASIFGHLSELDRVTA